MNTANPGDAFSVCFCIGTPRASSVYIVSFRTHQYPQAQQQPQTSNSVVSELQLEAQNRKTYSRATASRFDETSREVAFGGITGAATPAVCEPSPSFVNVGASSFPD